jgi:23S rRNA (guanosine2251-2'-O)-methyltransferase
MYTHGMKKAHTQWLVGKHAVEAALNAKRRTVKKILISDRHADKYADIIEQYQPTIPVSLVDKHELDKRYKDQPHQGIIAEVSPLSQPNLEDILPNASLLLILDQVTDPHNIGAVLRSADAFGCDAVILPAQNSAPITAVVAKAASGALETIPVITVGNLNKCLEQLQQEGFWSVGLDGDAEQTLEKIDLKGKIAIVMGSEGKGLRPLIAKNCDFLAKIPMTGTVESLNISVATGVTLYETAKQRA